MRLLGPSFLGFLLLIPLLVLLYILKQKFEEQQIPSLYLWQQVLEDSKAATPFQRLRKSILFFIQLLILLLLIFTLTSPFINLKSKNFENVIMVIDTSGSMSAEGESKTRLEEAKQKAEATVNSLASGCELTIISSGKNIKVEASNIKDKREAINKIQAIKTTNSAGNIDDSYSLIKAICSQLKNYRLIYYTDRAVDTKELNSEVVNLASVKNNVSLDYIAQTPTDQGLKVMLRTTNHGIEATNIELCVYGESKLLGVKDLALNKGETKTVYFDNLPQNNKYIYGEITENDGLQEDNQIFSIVKQKDAKKILLSTEQNVFLEKAISTLKETELFKVLPGEKLPPDYDLYIIDGKSPEELPKSGSLLIVNSDKSKDITGGNATHMISDITKYMGNNNFVISKLKKLEVPYWATVLLKVGDNPAAYAGENKGQKIGVLGFDIHNTDLPLTTDFPIFINNFISYLVDRDTIATTQYSCGDTINLSPLPQTEKISIVTPDKNNIELSAKYPVKPFEDTSKPGIYEIKQKIGDKTDSKLIAVNFPSSESDISPVKTESAKAMEHQLNLGGLNISYYLIILTLIVVLLEWIVYLINFGTLRKEVKNGD